MSERCLEGIKWERSGVRKTRLRARVDGKLIVIDLDKKGRRELFLAEDGRRIAGVAGTKVLDPEALLRAIAEEHYTNGHDWRVALGLAETRLAARSAP